MNRKTLAPALVLILLIVPHLTGPGLKGSTTTVQLTHNLTGDFNPVISADGSKIAFVSDVGGDFEIYVMNSDGTGITPLTSNTANDTSPAISGNGSKIVYESNRGTDVDIWIINSDGTGAAQLTTDSGDDVEPSISRDGLAVAFATNGDPIRGQNPEGDLEVFSMKTDGTGLRQLTHNSVTDSSPSINGDGTKVAFASGSGAVSEIWIINTDGTGLSRLTNNSYGDTSPSISASGQKIAFEFNGPATMSPLPLEATYPFEIYTVNSDGTGAMQVSGTTGDNVTPSLSGDGTKVAYVSAQPGKRQVVVVNSDGTGLTQITNSTALNVEPSIDYGGQTVVFMSNLDGDFEIFLARLTTTVHDAAIPQVIVPRAVGFNLITSNPLLVIVTVQNQGTVSESITVEFSLAGGPVLASQTVTLGSGVSQNITFTLDPKPLAKGTYNPIARAVPLPGEADISDNTRIGVSIQIRTPGDVDGDGDVDIIDAATLALAYGKTCGVPGYVASADYDNDCDIDIIDAATMALYYGTVP